jgi:hypothetical protein
MTRVFPQRLSQAQKNKAQRGFLSFATINALSYAALAESVLVLFALKLGANDFQAGLLSSYIHLTMVFILLGKVMVGRWGAARTYSTCWFGRNLVAALFIFSPWIWLHVSRDLGLIFLLLASFIFFALRAMGLSAENVLLNDFTSEDDRGRFIGRWQFFAYIGTLGMLLAVSFWLGDKPRFSDFQTVFAVGCFLGMLASAFLFNVPESEGPRLSSRQPMLKAFSLLYGERKVRLLLLAWVAIYCASQLLVPFQILAVKNGYLVSDRGAIVFVVLQTLGIVSASYLNSLFIDRSGPRPILILSVVGMMLVSLLWAVAPAKINLVYTGALFFMAGFFLISLQIGLPHYLLNTVRRENVLNLSLLILVMQGLSAGLVGTFLGGGLLETFRNLGLEGIKVYHTYFLFVLIALGAALAAVLRLRPLAERKVRDVLGMMFSLRDWQALISLQRLSDAPELEDAHKLLFKLGSLGSDVSEKTLLEYLDSPLFSLRTSALDALDKIEFGPEAAWRLIEEVKDGEFSTAFMAAEILGRHGVQEAVTTLRESLHSNDFYLEGKAMMALAQLGDRASYPRITEIFQHTYNPRLVIHGARALAFMGERENLWPLLKKLNPLMLPSEYDEIMHVVFSLLGWPEQGFRLLSLYNRSAQLGVDTLNDEVDRRLLHQDINIPSGELKVLKGALAEVSSLNHPAPDELVRLLGIAAAQGEGRARCLEVLIEEKAKLVREAPPRLRFSITALTVYLFLEHYGVRWGNGRE